jgi:hypothetical protein
MTTLPLTGWDNFYVMIGSSAAALTGLTFVSLRWRFSSGDGQTRPSMGSRQHQRFCFLSEFTTPGMLQRRSAYVSRRIHLETISTGNRSPISLTDNSRAML